MQNAGTFFMLFLLNEIFTREKAGTRRIYMEWVYLLIAGVSEVVWAVAMKFSEGFSKFLPSAITVAGYIISAVFLSLALRKLPLGTAYAIWTGFGIIGTSLLGILLFHETLNAAHILCILLIAGGIAGLKLLG
jgi:quaternary ammonium compound-resistance protein SugE